MFNKDGYWYPTVTEKSIYGFVGDYRWLSNFHMCDVIVDGILYPSSEHAYMAMKTDVLSEKRALSVDGRLTCSEAKKFGQTVTLRANWDDIKVQAMHDVVLAKFGQNRQLATQLIATGTRHLEETNYWGDVFWGVCRGKGHNWLGQVLMSVRDILAREEQHGNRIEYRSV